MVQRKINKTKKTRVLMFVSEDWYFLSHRLNIALALQRKGYEIWLTTRTSHHLNKILGQGIRVIPLEKFRRKNLRPDHELKALYEIITIYRRIKPQIVHHVAIKPIIYGSLAANFTGIHNIINAIAGMGSVSISNKISDRLVFLAITLFFSGLSFRKGTRWIVQNNEDSLYLNHKCRIPKNRIHLIAGSGVDIHRYISSSIKKSSVPVVILVGRMIWDKGVREFVEAAKIVKGKKITARFVLVGPIDPENPSSIDELIIRRWESEKVIEWWGNQEKMESIYNKATICCLPSYREGMPKALIEAAACRLPIIATNVAGCNEIVKHKINGILVPSKNSAALSKAIELLLENKELRQRFGNQGRKIVERQFSDSIVKQGVIDIYRKLI